MKVGRTHKIDLEQGKSQARIYANMVDRRLLRGFCAGIVTGTVDGCCIGRAVHGLGSGGAAFGCFARPRDTDAGCDCSPDIRLLPIVPWLKREPADRSSLARRSWLGAHCDPTVDGGRGDDPRRSRLRAGEELPGDDPGDESRDERDLDREECIMKGALGGKSGISIAYGIPVIGIGGIPGMTIMGMPIMLGGRPGVIMPEGIDGIGGISRLDRLPA